MKTTRLFDVLEYQQENYYQEKCLSFKYDGEWKSFSTSDVISITNQISLGLMTRGIAAGDKVGIISPNRPEWNFLDLAIQQIGAVSVPMYPNSTAADYGYICRHSEARMVFVADAELLERVQEGLQEENISPEIFSFDKIDGCAHWEQLRREGENQPVAGLQKAKAEVKPEDLVTIIYTSGTTGVPKGVMLCHNNITFAIEATMTDFTRIQPGWVTLSFLPLCHIFARALFFADVKYGVSIFYAESLEKIGDNLREVKPNYFATVPRLLEKVYDKILAKGFELGGVKKQIFFWALSIGKKFKPGVNQGGWYNYQLKWARKLVFSKWQEALGGNVEFIISGSAALQARLVNIFGAADIVIAEGYGLTETSPTISITPPNEEGVRPGYVGPIIPGIEVKIAEDGEILSRGPNTMMGYYKDVEQTAQVIDEEGWFHTGDIGELSEDNYLKITDRKKELFKTSGGKYIAPQPMENKFKESFLIDQIMVVGEERKFPGALIVPFFEGLREWCQQNHIPYSNDAEMIRHPEVQVKFQGEVDRLNNSFAGFQQVKNYELLAAPWSIDSKELTPTLKLRRKVIAEKYHDVIEALYAS